MGNRPYILEASHLAQALAGGTQGPGVALAQAYKPQFNGAFSGLRLPGRAGPEKQPQRESRQQYFPNHAHLACNASLKEKASSHAKAQDPLKEATFVNSLTAAPLAVSIARRAKFS